MKKFCFNVALATVVFAFVACGNSNKSASQADTESVEMIEEGMRDTTDVDSSSVITRGGTESEGFGRCSESGCNCKAFKGRGDTCGNCGHAYRKHY